MFDVSPCILMYVNFFTFATGFSVKVESKSLWGEIIKIVDGQDKPGSEKDVGNTLLLHFLFNIIGSKGKKGPNFPVKKAGSTCKTVHPEGSDSYLMMYQTKCGGRKVKQQQNRNTTNGF